MKSLEQITLDEGPGTAAAHNIFIQQNKITRKCFELIYLKIIYNSSSVNKEKQEPDGGWIYHGSSINFLDFISPPSPSI